jgi:outer membrane protein assembly factor BamB
VRKIKMQISKNKTMATAITIILLSSMVFAISSVPTTNAQLNWPDMEIPTWVYSSISPNPVGVNQELSIVFFNPQAPPGASATNGIVWKGFTIDITKPDGTTETLGPFDSDSTGAGFTLYTPDQVGNYTFTTTFPEQTWPDSAPYQTAYRNATWLESTFTQTITVQEEPVTSLNPTQPLPTEYWTRPIEGQNQEWYQVSSNWLASPHDANRGWLDAFYQADGNAPNSAHVLWTYPYEIGGVVGGEDFQKVPGEVFFSGTQYNMRITYPIVMNGKVYFTLPIGQSGGGISNSYRGSGWACVDLRTGEKIWENNEIGVLGSNLPAIRFGYLYDLNNMNEHGVVPGGLLFSQDFGTAYDPLTGTPRFNMTNVPSVTVPTYASASPQEVLGPNGEHIREVLVNAGNNSNPDWRLKQWNSSKCFTTTTSGTIDAGTSNRFDYDVAAPWRQERGSTVQIMAVLLGDIMLCSNGTNPYSSGAESPSFPEQVTYFGVSLKDENFGSIVWENTIQTRTDDNKDLVFRRAGEGVFVLYWSPTLQWVAYDMHTGKQLWSNSFGESSDNPFAYFIASSYYNRYAHSIANGILYSTGYSGHIYAYNLTTGNLLWTFKQPTGMRIFEYYPTFFGASCDGKIYLASHEHSADTPLFKGHEVVCLNASNGNVIWKMLGWGSPESFAIADGEVIYNNLYDSQIYAVGKGPTKLTVDAPMAAITQGNSLVIRGTITDESAGSKQDEQLARFPTGVPCVSEDSMGDWMEYVYMQKPRPTNTTGVPITISVVDANNNYREIGTAISDADGFFSYNWNPDIEGKFTVVATFAGSEGYWGSRAATAFAVDPAAATPEPTDAPPASMTDTYLISGIAAIIVVIVIGFVVTILMLRKRP